MSALLLLVLASLALTGQAIKTVVGPGQTECVAETVTQEHFQVWTI